MSIEILATKFSDVMGTYKHLSKFHFLESTFLSVMFDVGDFTGADVWV